MSILSGGFISYLCFWVEFWTRFVLINIPAAILAKFPEVDRICSISFAYLLLQVVGFCWAFLVNAAFAVACQAAAFIPLNDSFNEASTLQLVASFYFVYSSARVVVSFAQYAAYLALQSLQDFPHFVEESRLHGQSALRVSTVMFIPVVMIILSVLTADATCSNSFFWFQFLCNHTGLHFVSQEFPSIRKIMLVTCIFLVLQMWQVYLYQYPRWDLAMRRIPKLECIALQLTMLFIAIATLITLSGLVLSCTVPYIYETYFHLLWLPDPETWAWVALLGWTLWLCFFTRRALMASDGDRESSISSPPSSLQAPGTSLRHMARCLRLSQILFFCMFFFITSLLAGYLRAQLDTTLIGIATPAVVVVIVALTITSLQINTTLAYIGAPACLALALFVCAHMTSRIGGKGSILLVFAHAFGKMVQYFGNSLPGEEDDYTWDLPERKGDKSREKNGQGKFRRRSESLCSDESSPSPVTPGTPSTPSATSRTRPHLGNASRSSTDLVGTGSSTDNSRSSDSKWRRSISYDDLKNLSHPATEALTDCHNMAIQTLANRGLDHSALVSASLPSTVRTHWLTRLSSRIVGFSIHMARKVAITDTVLAGVMRAGTALGVVVALILGIISIASMLQQNMKLFPTLISFHESKGELLFNHIISNATLIKSPSLDPLCIANSSNSNDEPNWVKCDTGGLYTAKPQSIRKRKPRYAACDLRWNTLSLLDLAIFSELSYFDVQDEDGEHCSEGSGGDAMQHMIDQFFPGMGFVHVRGGKDGVSSPSWQTRIHKRHESVPDWVRWVYFTRPTAYAPEEDRPLSSGFTYSVGHPMYLEATSEKLGVTVIAVRGTDVGRLQDFLEDVKLFAEPVLMSLLSCVFPLMRLWADSTTSTIIQLLHESNVFFGLVGEAEYYQPLVQRVREISSESADNRTVILTGHSLGGGLARIVGALTTLPSVSFAPPGIALSHRKYSVVSESRGSGEGNDMKPKKRLQIKGIRALHDQSVAVLTDSDWIPQVDQQVGLIQKIMCDASDKSHQNACHLLEGTICHLMRHCGDDKDRFVDCSFSFNFNAVFPSLQRLVWKHRWIVGPVALTVPVIIGLAIVPEIV